ncbi:Protein hgh1 [Coemansia sp. RSA 2531]|nr:Protein hgh1 [Coemansia sp. RSA 2531]
MFRAFVTWFVLYRLTDVLVKGMDKTYNKDARFNCLASVFADATNHPFCWRYFLERTSYGDKMPITKIIVFSECPRCYPLQQSGLNDEEYLL